MDKMKLFREQNKINLKNKDTIPNAYLMSYDNGLSLCTIMLMVGSDKKRMFIMMDISVVVAEVMNGDLWLGDCNRLNNWKGWKNSDYNLGDIPSDYTKHPEWYIMDISKEKSHLMSYLCREYHKGIPRG